MNDMKNTPFEHKILVVDDDEGICNLIKTALAPLYSVTVCLTGAEAMTLMESGSYDLIITDLRLPDMSGIDILAYAKSRDEFAEVLMVTGYASINSATDAINKGVSSYMLKPFSIHELRRCVEKMTATRMFHIRCQQLMKRSDLVDPAVKGHVDDVTTLYHFTRKLMLTLEVSEVMRIVLEEVNRKVGSVFCTIEINLLEYREVYSMPSIGEVSRGHLSEVFSNNWNSAFSNIRKNDFDNGDVPHYIYRGRNGEFREAPEYKCLNFPLVVTGKTIGSMSVWIAADREIEHSLNQYLHVLTSITSPVIEHVYTDLQVRFQAKTDSLTGIANHRHFYEALEREIARSNRRRDRFALMLVDIDNFKMINDTYGHLIGDAVIIELTRHLCANIRVGDLVARYGGEEFGVILPETDLDGALVLANRICSSIATTPLVNTKHNIAYTASFGLTMYDGNSPSNKDELISRADRALYQSKRNGKNQVTVV